jgi:hypothetical protein
VHGAERAWRQDTTINQFQGCIKLLRKVFRPVHGRLQSGTSAAGIVRICATREKPAGPEAAPGSLLDISHKSSDGPQADRFSRRRPRETPLVGAEPNQTSPRVLRGISSYRTLWHGMTTVSADDRPIRPRPAICKNGRFAPRAVVCTENLKSGHSGDEVRPRWRTNLWDRIAEPAETAAYLGLETDVF